MLTPRAHSTCSHRTLTPHGRTSLRSCIVAATDLAASALTAATFAIAPAAVAASFRAAAAAFGLCSPPEDADAFVFWVTEALESMPQIDYQDAGSPVNATCEAVRRELQGVELLAALAAVTRRYYGVATDACLPQTSARNLQVAGGTP